MKVGTCHTYAVRKLYRIVRHSQGPVLLSGHRPLFCYTKANNMDKYEYDQNFEQFRDIYCGRPTYDNDEQWIANMDHMMALLCQEHGLAFTPQEGNF